METLAIFYGGKSSEHDISIITAVQVMNNINLKKYKIIPIYITYDNKWIIPNSALDMNIYAKRTVQGVSIACGFIDKYIIKKNKIGVKKLNKVDIAINCCHGLNGEDGTLSGLLELNEIPYVGSGVVASAVGMDKVFMKDIFVANNIPCAKYHYFFKADYEENKDSILNKIEKKFDYPIVVKPANLGSSIGINFAKNKEELIKNIEIALNFDKKIIIEEKINNLREINCSVIGNSLIQEISILEEPKNWTDFLNFNEKYLCNGKGKLKRIIDVKIDDDIEEIIKQYSKCIFKIFGCSGVVRIDFMLDDIAKKVYVNEINTIPGSLSNYLWNNKYSFEKLIDILIEYSKNEYIYNNMHKYKYESDVLKFYSAGSKQKIIK